VSTCIAGKIAFIDLTNSAVTTRDVDLAEYRKYLGGFGMAFKYAYDAAIPGTDPLDPANPISIFTGALVGTSVPAAIKTSAVTRMPLTGTFAWGHAGMGLANMLKASGYDGVVITGRAEKPVYLKIFDDEITFCDADGLWGKDTRETTESLQDSYPHASVASIGQAGENLVKMSLAMVDYSSTLGQGGMGAVMGSKNLKAIVVYGTKGVGVAKKGPFAKSVLKIKKRFMGFGHREVIKDLGMMAGWKMLLRSYISTEVMQAEEITREYGHEKFHCVKQKNRSCPGCLVADKEVIKIEDERFGTREIPTTSYVEIPSLAAPFNIKKLPEAAVLYDDCNRWGISSQTMEGFLEFLLELYEDGTLTSEDLGGLELERNFDSIHAMTEMIVNREGIGDLFADGWGPVIDRFGDEAAKHAYINKGSNVIWDPRLANLGTLEFQQIINPKGPYSAFGGSFTTVDNFPEEKMKRQCDRVGASPEVIERIFDSPAAFDVGRLTACYENWVTMLTCLGLCNRASVDRYYSADICVDLYKAGTGIDITKEELIQGAERVWNLTRLINTREGMTRADDVIPPQWFEAKKTADGKLHTITDYDGKELNLEDVTTYLDNYYEERGWDCETGVPTEKKMRELGLDDMVAELAR